MRIFHHFDLNDSSFYFILFFLRFFRHLLLYWALSIEHCMSMRDTFAFDFRKLHLCIFFIFYFVPTIIFLFLSMIQKCHSVTHRIKKHWFCSFAFYYATGKCQSTNVTQRENVKYFIASTYVLYILYRDIYFYRIMFRKLRTQYVFATLWMTLNGLTKLLCIKVNNMSFQLYSYVCQIFETQNWSGE